MRLSVAADGAAARARGLVPRRTAASCCAAPPATARTSASAAPASRQPTTFYPALRPLGLPGAGSVSAPRVGDSAAAEALLKRCRKWRDVLYEHGVRASDPEWGSAGAVASLRRLARALTIYDHKVQSQARTARDRAAAAVRDTRFAALAEAVDAALPGLDLHRLDAVRSSYATLGHAPGEAAVEAELQARFATQRTIEAVQAAPDADALLEEVASCGGAAMDAPAAVAALRALAQGCEGAADAERVTTDSRFGELLAALDAHVDGFADDRAASVLASLARLRATPPAALLEALVGALMRRSLATGSTYMVPTHVLQALGAMRQLHCTLRPRSAVAMAAIVVKLLPSCPPEKLPQLLIDAFAAGVAPQPLLAAAQPLLPAMARATSPRQLQALAEELTAAGAAPALVSQLQAPAAGGSGAAAPASAVVPRAVAAAARALHTLPAGRGLGCTAAPLRPFAPCAAARRTSRRGAALHARGGKAADAKLAAAAEEEINWATAAFAFVVPALGGALFGYDIGVTSGALVSLKGAATSGTDWGTALTSLQSGTVVSSSLAGALAGSALALTVGERIGRRAELLSASVLYFSGAALMAVAPSLGVLIAGRALYGGGIGFAMHGAPIYIAETAPSRVRGAFISAKEGFIVGGILLGYVAGAVLVDAPAGWREMLGVSALPAVLLGAGMLLLPDSPRWMVQAGRSAADAGDALASLRGSSVPRSVVDAEIKRIEASRNVQSAGFSGLAALLDPRNGRALYAGLSLMLFQQITGQPSVLYYATPIMQRAGFASAAAATQVSVILGGFKFLMTGIAVLSVDRVGRRPLLLAGVTMLVAALLALAALSGPTPPLEGEAGALASAACLLVYVGAYQVSFGPIAWLIVSEVFPQEVRTTAVGLATITNFGANFGVSLVLPLLEEAAGQDGTYLVFAALGVVALASIALTVPETKGKTLEEIERELQGPELKE
jgi:sugar porter (SP) family MFS transporter